MLGFTRSAWIIGKFNPTLKKGILIDKKIIQEKSFLFKVKQKNAKEKGDRAATTIPPPDTNG